MGTLVTALVVLVILIFLAFSIVKIVNEYERAVMFRLCRVVGARGPGVFVLVPVVVSVVIVDLGMVIMEVA